VVALTVVLGVVALLLAVAVAGLLRSRADALRVLRDLGVGEPTPVLDDGRVPEPADRSVAVPFTTGLELLPDGSTTSAPTIAGLTPEGDALAVAPVGTGQLTLLAFLSTDSSCTGLWESFRDQGGLGLPDGARLVVVTEGPDREVPHEVAGLASQGLSVVMSGDAWADYGVPGSPFFVLVDGSSGRRIGEGAADHFDHVAESVRQAGAGIAARSTHTVDVGSDGLARRSAAALALVGSDTPEDPVPHPAPPGVLHGPTDARIPDHATDVRRAS
jgi:hypothetical protein